MKPRQIISQGGARTPEPEGEPSDLRDASRDARRLYVNADTAALVLGFSTTKAFRAWLARHPRRLPTYRLGRALRFRPRDLAECVEPVGAPTNPFRLTHLSAHRRRA